MLFLLLLAAWMSPVQEITLPQLIETLGEANIQKGTAVKGRGENFLWAIESATRPELLIDDAPGPAMIQIEGTSVWYATGKLATDTSHGFVYKVDGKPFGGRKDVPAYGEESYLKPGVPTGQLSEKLVHTSKIYEGMSSDYWIYVPAQYDPKTPAALMVWQDGQSYIQRDNDSRRILDAVDNLTHEHKIPVMIQVFISPGTLQKSLRSVEYDTVSDRYARMLRDDLLPEVAAKYNIRKDAYSRGISGASSGGICAFNVAWQQPDQFSRVLSWIGSFSALQREPNEGGQSFPTMVRREPKRNIRVWLQDGAEDLENAFGSWPLQNIAMANSLKMREYDFHLSFGTGTHNSAQGSAEFPESFTWLWRDYDPAKTQQAYEIEPAEKGKPLFRVQIHNRDHDIRH